MMPMHYLLFILVFAQLYEAETDIFPFINLETIHGDDKQFPIFQPLKCTSKIQILADSSAYWFSIHSSKGKHV